MPTRSRRTSNNRKSNANRKRPTDLEERPKSRNTNRGSYVDSEACDGGDTGEDVEKYACCFGHAFTEPSRTGTWWLIERFKFFVGDLRGLLTERAQSQAFSGKRVSAQ